MDSFSKAATNRSIRTIKTELDFLLDSDLLTAQQVSSIHALLPDAPNAASNVTSPVPVTSPVHQMNNLAINPQPPVQNHFNEKSNPLPSPAPASPAPPAYNASPAIATASALYAYNPTDQGDLALMPHDRVMILENMNADWAKGRNERTGLEGIFPRSYVRVEEEKGGMPPPPAPGYGYNSQAGASGYGNMPLDVSQQGSGQQPQGENKVNEHGKKFGKKLGNAAIFGAGATIGGNIVNSIF